MVQILGKHRPSAWAEAREQVWKATQSRSGVALDARLTRALWESIQADCREMLAAKDNLERVISG